MTETNPTITQTDKGDPIEQRVDTVGRVAPMCRSGALIARGTLFELKVLPLANRQVEEGKVHSASKASKRIARRGADRIAPLQIDRHSLNGAG